MKAHPLPLTLLLLCLLPACSQVAPPPPMPPWVTEHYDYRPLPPEEWEKLQSIFTECSAIEYRVVLLRQGKRKLLWKKRCPFSQEARARAAAQAATLYRWYQLSPAPHEHLGSGEGTLLREKHFYDARGRLLYEASQSGATIGITATGEASSPMMFTFGFPENPVMSPIQ